MTPAELGMSSIPTVFPMPKLQDAFDAEGRPTDAKTERTVQGFLKEFEWYAEALKAARERGLPNWSEYNGSRPVPHVPPAGQSKGAQR